MHEELAGGGKGDIYPGEERRCPGAGGDDEVAGVVGAGRGGEGNAGG